MGVLKIDPAYFLDDMSVEGFNLAFDGYDLERKERAEQVRDICFYTAAPYLEGNPTKRNFMPLKWDEQNPAVKSTEERFNKLERKLTKIINNG